MVVSKLACLVMAQVVAGCVIYGYQLSAEFNFDYVNKHSVFDSQCMAHVC